MKNRVLNIIRNTASLETLLARFPIAILTLVVFTGFWIFKDFFSDKEQMVRTLAGLAIGAYLCVMQTVSSENRNKKPNLFSQIAFVLFAGGLAFFSESFRINMLMAVGAVLLALGNSIQWKKPKDNLRVWDFTHQIWTGAIFATAGSIIFGLGLLGIMAALSNLFSINIEKLAEYFLLPIGYGLLAPLYWLSFVPKANENQLNLLEEPTFISKAIAFMGTWLLAPLTLIYALILITYGVKIAVTMTLPNGEIAALTVPFLIIGTLTWLLLEPPFIQKNKFAKLFRAVWFPVSIPASILLAISVAVRVAEYGFTPDRLALIGCVIWALGIGLWFTLKGQSKADIRLIPGFAAALLGFGAMTTGWLSLSSQSARFERNLKTADILQGDGNIALDTKINKEAAKRAKGAVQYLLRNNGSAVIAKILNRPVSEVENTDAFMSSIRLKNVVVTSRYNQPTITYRRDVNFVDIRGFDFISRKLTSWKMSMGQQALYSQNSLKIEIDNGAMTISFDSDVLGVFDFEDWILNQKGPDDGFPDKIDPVILYESGGQKIVMLLISATRNIPDEDVEFSEHGHAEFYILTKGFE